VSAPPVASFLETEYSALHAFRFVASDGSSRFGRYRISPELGVRTLEPAEAEAMNPDYLREDLLSRLEEEPGSFTIHIALAGDGDDVNDPTTEWSGSGGEIVAGRLELTGAVEDQEGGCERLLFDPTRLCDGIEASDDPVLLARPRAYAVSSKKRLKSR
jgi:catalase